MNSPLAKMITSELSEQEKWEYRERLWHAHRVLVIHPDHEGLAWDDKQTIINIGNQIYGKGRLNGASK